MNLAQLLLPAQRTWQVFDKGDPVRYNEKVFLIN